MRITESQLRKIIRRIIKENAEESPADTWISLDDINRLIGNDDQVNKVFWDSIESGSTYNLMSVLPEKLFEDQKIRDRFFSQYGEDEDLLDKKLAEWFNENEKDIEYLLDKELSDAYEPESGNETDEIFGSEAGYWRYRNG